MTELIDEVSGLQYKRQWKPVVARVLEQLEEAENLSSVHDNVETYSVTSDSSATTVNTVFALNTPRPKVCSSEWLQRMPSKWNDSCKLRQFIIWAAESLTEELSHMGLEKNPIAEKVQARFIYTLKSSPQVVSLYKHPAEKSALAHMYGHAQPGRNSVNVENEKMLKEYQDDIAAIKYEWKQWDKCEIEIFERHARAADRLYALTRTDKQELNESNFSTAEIDLDVMILNDNLEITQTQELLPDLPFEIALFKQKMHTASEFNRRVYELAFDARCKLAHIERENSRVTPEDETLALFKNHELNRKKEQNENMQHLLRLYTRTPTKSGPSRASKL